MALNPRYNGRVGVYRTNEIEKFGFSVGDSYGGGIVAYIYAPGDPGYVADEVHGIIADTSDQSTGLIFGCLYTSIFTSTSLGSGSLNVANIIAGCGTLGTAPRVCDALVKNGYSDWTLPSFGDLEKLRENRFLIGGFSTSGPFDWYTSSSQANSTIVMCLGFESGGGYQPVGKEDSSPSIKTRAVRYF